MTCQYLAAKLVEISHESLDTNYQAETQNAINEDFRCTFLSDIFLIQMFFDFQHNKQKTWLHKTSMFQTLSKVWLTQYKLSEKKCYHKIVIFSLLLVD